MTDQDESLVAETDIAQRNVFLTAAVGSGEVAPYGVVKELCRQILELFQQDSKNFRVAVARSRIQQIARINEMIQRVREAVYQEMDLGRMTLDAKMGFLEREEKSMELMLRYVEQVAKEVSDADVPTVRDVYNFDQRQVIVQGTLRELSPVARQKDERGALPPATSRERVRELVEKLIEVRRNASSVNPGAEPSPG